jgi:hypothetical protein
LGRVKDISVGGVALADPPKLVRQMLLSLRYSLYRFGHPHRGSTPAALCLPIDRLEVDAV